MNDEKALIFCGCGCRQQTTNGNRFIHGHNKKLNDHANPSYPNAQFQPGNTASKGRPKGAYNRSTTVAMNLVDGEAETLTRRCIDLALQGNIPMLKVLIERLIPVRKSSPIQIALPSIENVCQVSDISKAILSHICAGNISPDEGSKLSTVVADLTRALQVESLDNKLNIIDASL